MSIIIVQNDRSSLRRLVGRPWWMTTARVDRNPFSSTTTLDYCHGCHEEVDTDTEAHHKGEQYVYRKRCLRCGTVVAWGAYAQVPLLESRAPVRAVHWALSPGRDRR